MIDLSQTRESSWVLEDVRVEQGLVQGVYAEGGGKVHTTTSISGVGGGATSRPESEKGL